MKGTEKTFEKRNKNQPDDSESSENEEHETVAYEGPFAIVEPIVTGIGQIGKWNLDEDVLPLHPTIAAFGKRRTGKTFSGRWVFYKQIYKRKIPFGVVFTDTSINGFWQKYVPPHYVYQGLQKHKMDALINRQKRIIAKWKKDHPAEMKKDPDSYKKAPELAAFCILDDVIADRVAMQWNEYINTFFVNGRHLCITTFITTQHVKGIGPMIRGNLDVAIIQPIFQREARMVLADLFGGFMDRNLFLQMMDDVVKDENLEGSTPQQPKKYVRTLIINDFENTTDPLIKFHYGEAENPDDIDPKWRLCDDVYWEQKPFDSAESANEHFDHADYIDQVFGDF